MTVPGWWQFFLLALAAYRLTRLAGWDEFPLAARIRAWAIGEHWVTDDQFLDDLRRAMSEPISEEEAARPRDRLEFVIPPPKEENELGLPGKQPSSEAEGVRAAYRRPTLAHLVHCPFCVGWWISLAVYAGWLAAPRATLYGMAPFALSGVVGLIAKNLDP